jgi:hypothetical protein
MSVMAMFRQPQWDKSDHPDQLQSQDTMSEIEIFRQSSGGPVNSGLYLRHLKPRRRQCVILPLLAQERDTAACRCRRRARQLATENVGGKRKENENDVARIERRTKKSHKG